MLPLICYDIKMCPPVAAARKARVRLRLSSICYNITFFVSTPFRLASSQDPPGKPRKCARKRDAAFFAFLQQSYLVLLLSFNEPKANQPCRKISCRRSPAPPPPPPIPPAKSPSSPTPTTCRPSLDRKSTRLNSSH